MPDDTTILSLPLILPAQAQKHVTHNEALVALDVIVQLTVINRTLVTVPPLPSVGDRHIVGAGATGPWAGQAGRIALYTETGWQFTQALPGWRAHVLAEGQTAVFDGLVWRTMSETPLTVPQLGVAATADAVNRLTVSSSATLLNHAGSDHQLKLNKAAVADTASLLFQTGFSGRAEMGTAGEDDFSVKVSSDGSTFLTALTAAAGSGEVTLPQPLHLGGQVADPASPADGTMWLNTTSGEVRVRSAGVTLPIGGGGGVTDGDKGDLTVSGGGATWTIDSGAVTLAKLADVATDSFLGRDTAGTGAPEVLTPAQARGILNVADGATANASDAALRDRATHTGTQDAATITGLASVATSGSAADLGAGTLPAARFNDISHGNRAGGALHAAATASVAGFMAAADKAKLDGVATGATANATDTDLRDRATHTGTQTAATISDLTEAVEDCVAALAVAGTNMTITYDDVAGTLTFAAAGGGAGTDLTYTSTTRLLASSSGADVTLPLVSATDAGLAPASGGGTTTFLRADGAWAVPDGGVTNLSWDAATRTLASDSGADAVLTLVTATTAGLVDKPQEGPDRFLAFTDMLTTAGGRYWSFSNSGTGTQWLVVVPQDGGIGWLQADLGTTATGRVGLTFTSSMLRFGLGLARAGTRCRINQLSNVTNNWTFRAGFLDSASIETTDGAFFRYNHAVSGGNFQAVTRSNSVETAVDTGITVAIATTYRLLVEVNAAGSEAGFYIDGNLVATIATNIPTASGRETGAGLLCLRSAGTAALNAAAFDYMLAEQLFTGR